MPASVLPGFRFGVKLPNALTLTHYPKTLDPNPHFLSLDLLRTFLRSIEPLPLGPLMFQFGYLNASMMPSQKVFQAKLGKFVSQLPAGYTWCIETRK